MKQKVKQVGAVGIFLIFTVFLYGPLSIYLPNAEELWFDLGTVLKIAVTISLCGMAALLLVGIVLPKTLYGIYLKLLFGVSLGLYIQGNYINVSYGSGVLDGGEIRWQDYIRYGYVNTAIWFICLILPWVIALAFKKVKALRDSKEIDAHGVLVWLSLFFFAIQIPALASQAIGYHPASSGELQFTEEGMFEYAPKENTIIFLLDTLDEVFLQRFLEAQPEYTEKLNGFVHYTDNMAAGGRTMLAMPALFTGIPYTRQNLYSDYKREVWSKKNALSAFHDAGYDVRVFSEDLYFDPVVADYVENMYSDGHSVPASYYKLAKKIYKMTLYKFVPHFAKKYLVMATSEFDSVKMASYADGIPLFTIKDPDFYKKYDEQGLTISDSYDKAFRFYHFHGAHSPYTMGADGTPQKDITRDDQIAGSFLKIGQMLDEMKEKGIYESSNIIIMADHGEKHVTESAALFIKEAGKGVDAPYEESAVPSSLFDLTIRLADIAGTTLENQKYGMRLEDLTEDMERERHFFYNTSNSTKVLVAEYVSTGKVAETDKTTRVAEFEDQQAADTLYKTGTVLEFGGDATANRYAVEGFSMSTGFTTYFRGPYACMEIPFEKKPEHTLSVRINKKSSPGNGTHLVITANGTAVFDDKVGKGSIDFGIPPEVFQEDKVLKLEFALPDKDQSELELSLGQRKIVYKVIDIAFEEKKK